MRAIGLIETKGLLAAIEAADTMVKSADVNIVEKTYIGGGLVTIVITGDVSAVKAAVEAAVAAVNKLDKELLVSEHVIARPHEDIATIMGPDKSPEAIEKQSTNIEIDNVEPTETISTIEIEEVIETTENVEDTITEDNIEEIETVESEIKVEDVNQIQNFNLENLQKENIDNLVNQKGLDQTIEILSRLKVVKLRTLAREYKDFMIKGRAISKAGKKMLITKFRAYYEKN